MKGGDWKHMAAGDDEKPIKLDIDKVFETKKFRQKEPKDIEKIYNRNLEKAIEMAENLPDEFEHVTFEHELEKLIFFHVKNIINYKKYEGKQYV
jgi:hypothetical protein